MKKVDKGYKKVDRGYKKVDKGYKKSWSLIDQPHRSAALMQHEIDLHNKILASFQLFYQSITIYGVLIWTYLGVFVCVELDGTMFGAKG